MRCRTLLFVAVVATACGRDALLGAEVTPSCPACEALTPPPGPDTAPMPAAPDAGPEDAGVTLACDNVPFGPDCCAGGARVTSATCVDGAWACGQGEFCTCEGRPQTFLCSDFCGSDAVVAPVCANGEWICSRPLIETSECGPDTCWGEPGDCCGAPACVDGQWVCGFKPAGC